MSAGRLPSRRVCSRRGCAHHHTSEGGAVGSLGLSSLRLNSEGRPRSRPSLLRRAPRARRAPQPPGFPRNGLARPTGSSTAAVHRVNAWPRQLVRSEEEPPGWVAPLLRADWAGAGRLPPGVRLRPFQRLPRGAEVLDRLLVLAGCERSLAVREGCLSPVVLAVDLAEAVLRDTRRVVLDVNKLHPYEDPRGRGEQLRCVVRGCRGRAAQALRRRAAGAGLVQSVPTVPS